MDYRGTPSALAVWRDVVLPGHQIQVAAAREHGLQVLFWFLGDCIPLLGDLLDLGIDGLVIEQGRRGYSSDPVEVRRMVGGDMCVYGWNWELDFVNDRRENITREVERQISGAGADGAFIMGTTYMTSEAKLEAVDHFCEEVVRVSGEAGYWNAAPTAVAFRRRLDQPALAGAGAWRSATPRISPICASQPALECAVCAD